MWQLSLHVAWLLWLLVSIAPQVCLCLIRSGSQSLGSAGTVAVKNGTVFLARESQMPPGLAPAPVPMMAPAPVLAVPITPCQGVCDSVKRMQEQQLAEDNQRILVAREQAVAPIHSLTNTLAAELQQDILSVGSSNAGQFEGAMTPSIVSRLIAPVHYVPPPAPAVAPAPAPVVVSEAAPPAQQSTDGCIRITVTSVDHESGDKGKFFNFDRSEVPEIAEGNRSEDKNDVITVTQVRTGKTGDVVVWGTNNGGETGGAHGRWDLNPAEGQFQVGDILESSECPLNPLLANNPNHRPLNKGSGVDIGEDQCLKVTVTSVDHKFGTVGEFFNFDRSDIPEIDDGGRSVDKSEVFQVRQLRTGLTGPVVVFGYNHGGSTGGAHGRWLMGSKEGQWQVGDVLESLGCEAERKLIIAPNDNFETYQPKLMSEMQYLVDKDGYRNAKRQTKRKVDVLVQDKMDKYVRQATDAYARALSELEKANVNSEKAMRDDYSDWNASYSTFNSKWNAIKNTWRKVNDAQIATVRTGREVHLAHQMLDTSSGIAEIAHSQAVQEKLKSDVAFGNAKSALDVVGTNSQALPAITAMVAEAEESANINVQDASMG